ncbi:MAG: class I SAM-dependent methyltransferase [Planctomycetes bacterium]|nr:class I SAM-dependent methyltransferase [Planctomycetota bacterium]
MPSSTPYALPTIASIARQLRPRSVLDVGIGFGKYGYLFREYLDIWDMEDVGDYDRDRWKVIIEGIEATPEYITPLHDYIYDTIHVGDVTEIIDGLGLYDVIIIGDVIEHFPKPIGEALLDKLYAHTGQCLLLTFPPNCPKTHDTLHNPRECHRSSWDRQDFRRFPNVAYKLFEGRSALVALTKPPHTPPVLTPCFGVRRRRGWKGLATSLLVRTLGASTASRLATWLAGEPVVLRT